MQPDLVYVERGLLTAPTRLGDEVPAGYRGWVVLDEIQRLPELLYTGSRRRRDDIVPAEEALRRLADLLGEAGPAVDPPETGR